MLALFVAGAIISVIWYAIVGAIGGAIFGQAGVTINPDTGVISTSGGPGFFGTLILGVIGGLVYYTVVGFIQAAITRRPGHHRRQEDRGRHDPVDRPPRPDHHHRVLRGHRDRDRLPVLRDRRDHRVVLPGVHVLLPDRPDLAPTAALSVASTFVQEHLGDLLVFYLVSLVVYFIGAILCGIGLLSSRRPSCSSRRRTYKKFTNQAVAA
jgi:hypothetical protein